MKAVLISINPKWCELIASGKKTVEVRKTRPKIDVPFKCYIYCTKGKDLLTISNGKVNKPNEIVIDLTNDRPIYELNGRVIGEFVCDKIVKFENKLYDEALDETVARSCVPMYDLLVYLGKQDYGYGWHISDLVIYENPLDINDFVAEGDCTCEKCNGCKYFERGNGYNVESDCLLPYQHNFKTVKPLFRPPQSWCYIEEVAK